MVGQGFVHIKGTTVEWDEMRCALRACTPALPPRPPPHPWPSSLAHLPSLAPRASLSLAPHARLTVRAVLRYLTSGNYDVRQRSVPLTTWCVT